MLLYCVVLTSYSWENRRPSLAFSRSMWSARSMTGIGGCSLIPGRGRGGGGGEKTNSELWLCLHRNCTWTDTNHEVSEAAGGTMMWLWTVRKVQFVQQCKTRRRGDLEREGERDRKIELVISGNVVMLNENDRGGTGTEMHMRDRVSMLLEGNRKQTSLWLHNAQLVTEVGSAQEPTLVTANQSHCQFPERRRKKKKTLTGHQLKLISLKIFPNNSLAYGLAWSTWAGLIPSNPSKPFSRFLIAKLLDDLLLIYRHKFPLCLWTWHGLNGLQRTCLTC